MEKWILHKLNTATAEINTYLGERNFMLATNSAYNFWLYELCDVYIVRHRVREPLHRSAANVRRIIFDRKQ